MTELDKAQAVPKSGFTPQQIGVHEATGQAGFKPPKASDGAQVPWTLWEEAASMDSALARVVEHCQQLRSDMQRGLRELERMLGSMPKRS